MNYEADSIRVLFHQKAREFVPHNARITIRANEDERSLQTDTDWRDIAIFPLQRTLYTDDQFADQKPYPILSRNMLWHLGLGGHFIMRGFPHDLSVIDYEGSVLREQAVILQADLVGPAPMEHCFQIRLHDLSPCSDLVEQI